MDILSAGFKVTRCGKAKLEVGMLVLKKSATLIVGFKSQVSG